jgi:hypothetical protein
MPTSTRSAASSSRSLRTAQGRGRTGEQGADAEAVQRFALCRALAIGTDELIRSFKPDALRRFYRDWYRPELMAVVAVGDVEPEELERRSRRISAACRIRRIAAPAHLGRDPAALAAAKRWS